MHLSCTLPALAILVPLAARAAPCAASALPCPCAVAALHPLQGAIGIAEVNDKLAAIKAKPDKHWKKLIADPIKVVRGPDGGLYITDHHHAADAWRLAGHAQLLCKITEDPAYATQATFWPALIDRHLVHLEDRDGKPLRPDQLPRTLADMQDDPYRSLAGALRESGGFCRALLTQPDHAEFVEFRWADWLRSRPELPASALVSDTPDTLPPSAVAIALKLARSPAAAGLPGYVGNQPAGYQCPTS